MDSPVPLQKMEQISGEQVHYTDAAAGHASNDRGWSSPV